MTVSFLVPSSNSNIFKYICLCQFMIIYSLQLQFCVASYYIYFRCIPFLTVKGKINCLQIENVTKVQQNGHNIRHNILTQEVQRFANKIKIHNLKFVGHKIICTL